MKGWRRVHRYTKARPSQAMPNRLQTHPQTHLFSFPEHRHQLGNPSNTKPQPQLITMKLIAIVAPLLLSTATALPAAADDTAKLGVAARQNDSIEDASAPASTRGTAQIFLHRRRALCSPILRSLGKLRWSCNHHCERLADGGIV